MLRLQILIECELWRSTVLFHLLENLVLSRKKTVGLPYLSKDGLERLISSSVRIGWHVDSLLRISSEQGLAGPTAFLSKLTRGVTEHLDNSTILDKEFSISKGYPNASPHDIEGALVCGSTTC